MDLLEDRVATIEKGQERIVLAVDNCSKKLSELGLQSVTSETVKIQEEQKTKRWVALIGLLTMIAAPLLTVTVNVLTREDPQLQTQVVESAMKLELDACAKAPNEKDYVRCVGEAAARNAPARAR